MGYILNNRGCFRTDEDYENKLIISGVFGTSDNVGTKYQCKYAGNDFHVILNENSNYEGDTFVQWSLDREGNQKIFLNGELVIEDIFCTKKYANNFVQYLDDISCPIQTGVSYIGPNRNYKKGEIYSIRVFNKVLSNSEMLANYNATVSYHNILVNNGNASTGGNTGGEDIDTIE